MHLANFIRDHQGPIIEEWECFAKTFVPAAENMSPLALRNHIRQILSFIVEDISTPQSREEQAVKSHGEKPPASYPSAAETHASLRHDGGFNMNQMVSEYRALRASVIKLWKASHPDGHKDIEELTRFHEAVDQAMTESIHDYSRKMETSRNLFLGILGHDLRNPLAATNMAAQLTLKLGGLSETQTTLQTQIVNSSHRASDIITNLLDLTRTRLGSGLPIIRTDMDMGYVARQLVDEVHLVYPNRDFKIVVTGDVTGIWDKPRIGQILSNLLGNAIQYGFSSAPVCVRVEGLPREVVLSVHNEGVPIRPDAIDSIFNSLTRVTLDSEDAVASPDGSVTGGNLGLGLYICREIMTAHGGTISATSTERDGTKFTARFPRPLMAFGSDARH